MTWQQLPAMRSGSVVKGQYAGCSASGQPLTKVTRKDPFDRVVAVCYRSCLPARVMICFVLTFSWERYNDGKENQ